MKKRAKVDTELLTVLNNNTIVWGEESALYIYIYSFVCFLFTTLGIQP